MMLRKGDLQRAAGPKVSHYALSKRTPIGHISANSPRYPHHVVARAARTKLAGDSTIDNVEYESTMEAADTTSRASSSTASSPAAPPIEESRLEMVNCHILVPRYVGEVKGEKLILVGSTPSLGSWSTARGVPLSLTSVDKNESYFAEVMIPLGTAVEVKVVTVSLSGKEIWEEGDNRSFTLQPPTHTGEEGSPGGGYLVMLHHGMGSNSTQVTYFPPFPPYDENEPLKMCSKSLCRFTVPHKTTQVGEYLVLVGSLPQLGAWDASKGFKLISRGNNVWSADLLLPSTASFEAKVVVCKEGPDGKEAGKMFESGSNRSFNLNNLLTNHFSSIVKIEKSIDEDEDDENLLHPLCLFTCYWGVDETSVIVGSTDPKIEDVNSWPVLGMSKAQITAVAAEWQAKLTETEVNAKKAYRAYEEKLMGLEALLEDQKYSYEQQLLTLQKDLLEEQDNLKSIEGKLLAVSSSLVSAEVEEDRSSALRSALEEARSELAVKEATYRDEVLRLKSEITRLASQLDDSRSELSSLRSKMAMERQAMEDELMRKLAQLQASYDEKDQSNGELRELLKLKEEEFELKYQLLIEEQAEELNELLIAAAAEAADAAMEATASSASSAAPALAPASDPRGKNKKGFGRKSDAGDAALKASHASEIQRLTKSHVSELDRLRKEHEEKMKALRAENDVIVQSLKKIEAGAKASQSTALEKKEKEHQMAIESLTSKHHKEMKDAEVQFLSKLEGIKSDQAHSLQQTVQDLTISHERMIQDLTSRHGVDMNALRAEYEQREAMMRSIFDSREQDLISQMESIMAELMSSQRNAQGQADALEQQFDLTMAQQQQLELQKTHQAAMQKLHERQMANQQSAAVAALEEQSKALKIDYQRKVASIRARASKAVRWLVQRTIIDGVNYLRSDAKAVIHKARIETRAAELTLKATEEGANIKVTAAVAEAKEAKRQAEELRDELARLRKAANDEIESYRSQLLLAQSKLDKELKTFETKVKEMEDRKASEVSGVKKEYVEAVSNFEWQISQLEKQKAEMEQRTKVLVTAEQDKAAKSKMELEERHGKELALAVKNAVESARQEGQFVTFEQLEEIRARSQASLAKAAAAEESRAAAVASFTQKMDQAAKDASAEIDRLKAHVQRSSKDSEKLAEQVAKATKIAEDVRSERDNFQLALVTSREMVKSAEAQLDDLKRSMSQSSSESVRALQAARDESKAAEVAWGRERVSYQAKVDAAVKSEENARLQLQQQVEVVAKLKQDSSKLANELRASMEDADKANRVVAEVQLQLDTLVVKLSSADARAAEEKAQYLRQLQAAEVKAKEDKTKLEFDLKSLKQSMEQSMKEMMIMADCEASKLRDAYSTISTLKEEVEAKARSQALLSEQVKEWQAKVSALTLREKETQAQLAQAIDGAKQESESAKQEISQLQFAIQVAHVELDTARQQLASVSQEAEKATQVLEAFKSSDAANRSQLESELLAAKEKAEKATQSLEAFRSTDAVSRSQLESELLAAKEKAEKVTQALEAFKSSDAASRSQLESELLAAKEKAEKATQALEAFKSTDAASRSQLESELLAAKEKAEKATQALEAFKSTDAASRSQLESELLAAKEKAEKATQALEAFKSTDAASRSQLESELLAAKEKQQASEARVEALQREAGDWSRLVVELKEGKEEAESALVTAVEAEEEVSNALASAIKELQRAKQPLPPDPAAVAEKEAMEKKISELNQALATAEEGKGSAEAMSARLKADLEQMSTEEAKANDLQQELESLRLQFREAKQQWEDERTLLASRSSSPPLHQSAASSRVEKVEDQVMMTSSSDSDSDMEAEGPEVVGQSRDKKKKKKGNKGPKPFGPGVGFGSPSALEVQSETSKRVVTVQASSSSISVSRQATSQSAATSPSPQGAVPFIPPPSHIEGDAIPMAASDLKPPNMIPSSAQVVSEIEIGLSEAKKARKEKDDQMMGVIAAAQKELNKLLGLD